MAPMQAEQIESKRANSLRTLSARILPGNRHDRLPYCEKVDRKRAKYYTGHVRHRCRERRTLETLEQT